MSDNVFTILITDATGDYYWYAGLVGHIFTVIEHGDDYVLLDNYLLGYGVPWFHIYKPDCEVISIKPLQLDS